MLKKKIEQLERKTSMINNVFSHTGNVSVSEQARQCKNKIEQTYRIVFDSLRNNNQNHGT